MRWRWWWCCGDGLAGAGGRGVALGHDGWCLELDGLHSIGRRRWVGGREWELY